MKSKFILALFVSVLLVQVRAEKPSFTDVNIQPPFKELIQADPMMMEYGGARIVEKKDESLILFAIGYTTNKDPMHQRTVAKSKAIRDLLAHVKGQEVEANKKLNRTTTSVQSDDEVSYKIVKTLKETIQISVGGKVRALPVVGTWKSLDGDLFYLVVGGLFGPDGERIESGDTE